MAYKVKQLLDKGLDLSSLDKDLRDDIETIKFLSGDFSKDDSDAMQLDALVYEQAKSFVKSDEKKPDEPSPSKGKRGRPKGSVKSAPKKKGKRGRPAKQEKAPAKPKVKYKTEPKSDGSVPDCDELLKRWRERRQKAKDMGKKRRTKPVFTKISEGVVSAVEKAIKNVPKADIKAQPVRTVKKFEVLRDAADKFLKAFKSVLGEDYIKTEAEKELSDLEGLISTLQEKYVKKYGDGGMMNAEGGNIDYDEINELIWNTYDEDSFVEKFYYFTNPIRGNYISEEELRERYSINPAETIDEYDPYLFYDEFANRYKDGGMAEGDEEDMPVIRTQFEEDDYEYATGGGVGGEQITMVAEAIFSPNEKNGKIKISTKAPQSLGGLKYLIADLNSEYIASAIFEENQVNGKIETTFGEKTYGQLLAMISQAKANRLDFVKHAGGGKIKEISFENSNLYLYGFGKDSNGNTIVKVGFPNQRAFSIQTNGVLNFTHDKRGYKLSELDSDDISRIESEVVEYVKNAGSKEQKSKLKTY